MRSVDEKGTLCSGCPMLLCSLQAGYKGALCLQHTRLSNAAVCPSSPPASPVC